MSSIAYVTDSNMIEYHRLCGSRRFNFWRLSARAAFSDFRKGDLLFFYAYGRNKKRKGFVGYAHFDGARKLSLKQMWKEYGTLNGFDTRADLEEAIRRASRDHEVPERMSCLLLSDAVFFSEPVYPKEANVEVNEKLESYMYLDRNDPEATLRILRIARQKGIDPWASSQSDEPENVFELDETREILAAIAKELGEEAWTREEKKRARALASAVTGFEPIRGSEADAFVFKDGRLTLVFPYVASIGKEPNAIRALLGKMMYYRSRAVQFALPGNEISFEVLCEEGEPNGEFLKEAASHV
ncbi:MAG: hypothetical protein IKD66_09475 [Solobacterium sp.]|nr:hypothetical protein [Solobacterium sp.]